MAFIPTPNTARVSLTFTQDGQQLVNVFYFTKDDGYTSEVELEALAQSVVDNWRIHVLPMQVADVTGVIVKAVDTSQPDGFGTEFIDPMTGTNAGTAMPVNDTFCIKWVTGRVGRSYRGRTYHIGLMSQAVADSKVLVGSATDFVEAYNGWFEAMLADGNQLVIASFTHNGAPRTSAVITFVTGATYADLNLDSQRRRLPGRGT